ncbi:MAG: hypothetical protein ACYCOU_04365 [Sulfobacillus sp.]
MFPRSLPAKLPPELCQGILAIGPEPEPEPGAIQPNGAGDPDVPRGEVLAFPFEIYVQPPARRGCFVNIIPGETVSKLASCLRRPEPDSASLFRFVALPLIMRFGGNSGSGGGGGGVHMNMVIYDGSLGSCEIYDPEGRSPDVPYYFRRTVEDAVLGIFDELHFGLTGERLASFVRPESDEVGIQRRQKESGPDDRSHGDLPGYCLMWCMFYLEKRLQYPDVLPHHMKQALDNSFAGLTDAIRSYGNFHADWSIERLKRSLTRLPPNERLGHSVRELIYLTELMRSCTEDTSPAVIREIRRQLNSIGDPNRNEMVFLCECGAFRP